MQSRSTERFAVIIGIIPGLVLSGTLFTAGYNFLPGNAGGLDTPMQRLVFTLRWQSISVLTLLFGVVVIANKRFMSPAINPISGKGEQLLAVDVRYLQNTLEQFILSVLAQLVLSTYLSPITTSRVIPTLVFMFTLARIVFWISYRISPLRRAVGFAMTFHPTVCVIVCNIWFLFNYGPQF